MVLKSRIKLLIINIFRVKFEMIENEYNNFCFPLGLGVQHVFFFLVRLKIWRKKINFFRPLFAPINLSRIINIYFFLIYRYKTTTIRNIHRRIIILNKYIYILLFLYFWQISDYNLSLYIKVEIWLNIWCQKSFILYFCSDLSIFSSILS